MENFPGNPYAGPQNHTVSTEAHVIANAIELLAFEVRTLNLQIAARPLVLEGVSPDLMRKISEKLGETDGQIRERLGIEPPE